MRYLIEPEGNRAVVRWLRENSERPIAAMNLWSLLLERLHHGTGQVLLSRGELAGEVGVTPREITFIMKELADIDAVSRRPHGSRVSYSVNRKLFVTPRDQEEGGRIPVFEPVESEEEEAGKGHPSSSEGEQYSIELPEEEREAPPWTLGEAARLEAGKEADLDMSRRRAADAAIGVWAYWRQRLFPGKRKDD